MSIFSDAQVVVLIADYIGVDAAGKVNAIGANFGIAGVGPNGMSGPHYVIALVDIPAKYNGQQFSLQLELRDLTTGQPVMLPTTPQGDLQPLRLQQVVTVQLPVLAGVSLDADHRLAKVQMPVAFTDGIPLAPGHAFSWKVDIDGQSRPGWHATFAVPGPPPPPVFGGPVGPATIPNIAPLSSPPVDDPSHERPAEPPTAEG